MRFMAEVGCATINVVYEHFKCISKEEKALVRKALSRLAKKGLLRRVARGVYCVERSRLE